MKTQVFEVELTDLTGQFPIDEDRLAALLDVVLSNAYRITVREITKPLEGE